MKKLLIIFILSCVACTVYCQLGYAQIASPTQTEDCADFTIDEIAECPEEAQLGSGLRAIHTPLNPRRNITITWYDAFLIVAVVLTVLISIVVTFKYIIEKDSLAKSIYLLAFVVVLFGTFFLVSSIQERLLQKKVEHIYQRNYERVL